jgi:hypothetical protein
VTWIRISVLAAILVVVSVVSLSRLESGPGAPVATKHGVTSQGRTFAVKVDDRGRPVAFDTELAALCPNGRMISMPWSPVDGDAVRFAHAGNATRVAEKGDGWELSLDARRSAGGTLRGTMELVVHVRPKSAAAFDCASPKVRVSAGAS